MKTSPIYHQRLLKLADHLHHGKLAHKIFDFSVINSIAAPRCGTRGCALGELPALFPYDWEFDKYGEPQRRNQPGDHLQTGPEFFGISSSEFYHLFYPNAQDSGGYGGRRLDDKSSRKQVAANLYIFLERAARRKIKGHGPPRRFAEKEKPHTAKSQT